MRLDGKVRIVRLLFLTGAALQSATGQIPGLPSVGTPAPQKSANQDPLGRDTPYGCVSGFLRAAAREDYNRAVEYLQIKPSPKALELAGQLRDLMDAGVHDLESLSKFPEGELADALLPNRERVGTLTFDTGTLDIMLERVQTSGRPAIWLFSAETLRRVPEVVDQIGTRDWESYIPLRLRNTRIFSVPLYRWIGTLAGVGLTLLLAWLVSRLLWPLVLYLIRRINGEQDNRRFAALRPPLCLILVALGLHTLGGLSLTVLSRQFWGQAAAALAVLGTTWLFIRASDVVADRAARTLTRRQAGSKLAVLSLLHRLLKVGLAIAGGVAILYVVGADVTAILAGVGLGGVVIALAAQKTLENLFGGVAVISDEPIRVGDFCRFVDKFGTIEDIGLRSTRVRTLDRTILSIPNGQLSLMTLENFTLRDKFLFNQKIGVRYETTPAQMRCILRGIRELILTHPKADRADARVRLIGFGDSAITIEVFTYLFVDAQPSFLETQEELLMSILDIIVAAGSGVAFPSRTLYVKRDKPNDPVLAEEAAARTRERVGLPQ